MKNIIIQNIYKIFIYLVRTNLLCTPHWLLSVQNLFFFFLYIHMKMYYHVSSQGHDAYKNDNFFGTNIS